MRVQERLSSQNRYDRERARAHTHTHTSEHGRGAERERELKGDTASPKQGVRIVRTE